MEGKTHLGIRRQINRQMTIRIPLIGLGSSLKQLYRSIPMTLRNSLMQRRQPIHVRRIDGTLPVL